MEQIFDIIRELKHAGTTILLVEQNAQMALSIADRAYVLETGKIVNEAPPPTCCMTTASAGRIWGTDADETGNEQGKTSNHERLRGARGYFQYYMFLPFLSVGRAESRGLRRGAARESTPMK